MTHSREKIKETAVLERKYIIEACVMRLMKAKKKMTKNELMEEIIHEQEYFQITPELPFIKSCIDSLVDKEYL